MVAVFFQLQGGGFAVILDIMDEKWWKLVNFFGVAAGAGILLGLLYPGDTVFLRDEALLHALALTANEAGVPASTGLTGTVGASYGALVVWFNQLLLLLTCDPVWMASVKCLIATFLSLAGIVLIARARLLPVAPAAALWFTSPFIWFYNRMPWDNVWLLPLSLLAFAGAARYLRDGRIRDLILCALMLDAMVFLHPVALPVPPGFAVGLGVLRFRARRREWAKLLATGCGALLLIAPYLLRLAREFAMEPLPPQPWPETIAAACSGIFNLTGIGFLVRFLPETIEIFPEWWLLPGALLIVGLALTGLLAFLQAARRKREWHGMDSLCTIALAVIAMSALMTLVLRREHQVHYNSAVTAAYWILAWRGFLALQADYRRTARIVLAVAVTLNLLLIAVSEVYFHRMRGSASPQVGPVLAEQWNAARVLLAAYRKNPNLEVRMEIERFRTSPESLQILIRLAERSPLPEIPAFRRITVAPSPENFGILLIGGE